MQPESVNGHIDHRDLFGQKICSPDVIQRLLKNGGSDSLLLDFDIIEDRLEIILSGQAGVDQIFVRLVPLLQTSVIK